MFFGCSEHLIIKIKAQYKQFNDNAFENEEEEDFE